MNATCLYSADQDPPAPPPEQALWLAVVEAAVRDCLEPRCCSNAAVARVLRRQARSWVLGSPDFLTVCELAGVQPESVRNVVRRMNP